MKMNYLKLTRYTLVIILAFMMIIAEHGTSGKMRTKHKKKKNKITFIPSINDLKEEYLTQNTDRYIRENNLAQSDIEVNPMRYALLNGKDRTNDPLMRNGEVYSKDSNAYYPYVKEKNLFIGPPPPKRRNYPNSVYPLDQKPYYGPSDPYRLILNMPKDRVAVPIQLGDLTKTHASETNLKRMENELAMMDAPEPWVNINKSGTYLRDPKPYYDPTVPEKEMYKTKLKESIENMREDLLHPNLPDLSKSFKRINASPMIQNYVNSNKEETNELIANSYYYPIKKDGKGNNLFGSMGGDNKNIAFEVDKVEVPEGVTSNMNELSQSGSILGVEHKNTRTPHKIVPSPGVVFGTPRKNVNNYNVNPNSKLSKYVEADEDKHQIEEVEVVGESLGSKYVDDKGLSVKKNTYVEADSIEKKVVEADENKHNNNSNLNRKDNFSDKTKELNKNSYTLNPVISNAKISEKSAAEKPSTIQFNKNIDNFIGKNVNSNNLITQNSNSGILNQLQNKPSLNILQNNSKKGTPKEKLFSQQTISTQTTQSSKTQIQTQVNTTTIKKDSKKNMKENKKEVVKIKEDKKLLSKSAQSEQNILTELKPQNKSTLKLTNSSKVEDNKSSFEKTTKTSPASTNFDNANTTAPIPKNMDVKKIEERKKWRLLNQE